MKYLFSYGVLCLLLTSCLSSKKITYFQPANPSMDEYVEQVAEAYTPRIKSEDILSITVSSLNRDANVMFNPMIENAYFGIQTVGTTAPLPIQGFTVDAAGDITLPMIGKMHVAGLKSSELSVQLTEKLQLYLESPTVTVRIANYTVSILGEVARPAMYTIPNERITIPEALALAGDMTMYGKRKNVLVIRETDGNRQYARIDLTKRDMFTSPYYYLRAGDILYVEPLPGRIIASDRVYQLSPIVISSLTLLVLIVTTFVK